jgi:membrane-associated protease RseP (regulator of RpoE activity)
VAHFLAPTIRVEQVGADSIATRVLIQATGSGSLEEFVVEMDRESAEAAERALVRRPAAAEPRIAWLQGERQEAPLPARSIEEVRPLSPYVAGLTRVAGAQLRSLGPGLGQYFQVDRGLLVTEVAEGTPAAVAGLRGGDVIVEVGGREVTTLGELRAALATGQGRVLEVVRRGERLTVTLR